MSIDYELIWMQKCIMFESKTVKRDESLKSTISSKSVNKQIILFLFLNYKQFLAELRNYLLS